MTEVDIELRLFKQATPTKASDDAQPFNVTIRGDLFECDPPSARPVTHAKSELDNIRLRRMGFLDGACEVLEDLTTCYGVRVTNDLESYKFIDEKLYSDGSAIQFYSSIEGKLFEIRYECSKGDINAYKLSTSTIIYKSPRFCDYRPSPPPLSISSAPIHEYAPHNNYANTLHPLSNPDLDCLEFKFGPATASYCHGRSFSHYYLKDDGLVDLTTVVTLGRYYTENKKIRSIQQLNQKSFNHQGVDDNLLTGTFNPSTLFGNAKFSTNSPPATWPGDPSLYLSIITSLMSPSYVKMPLKMDLGGGDGCPKAQLKASGPPPGRNVTVNFFCAPWSLMQYHANEDTEAQLESNLSVRESNAVHLLRDRGILNGGEPMGFVEKHLAHPLITQVEFFSETTLCEYDLRISTPLVCPVPFVSEVESSPHAFMDDYLTNQNRRVTCRVKTENFDGRVGFVHESAETRARRVLMDEIRENASRGNTSEKEDDGIWFV